MTTLEKTKAEAQRTANRQGEALAVLNLNRAGSPMYVIREAPDAAQVERNGPGWHVETFEPDRAAVLDLSQPVNLPRYVVAPMRNVSDITGEAQCVQTEDDKAEFWGVFEYAAGDTWGDATRVAEADTLETAHDAAQLIADEADGVFLANYGEALQSAVRAAARFEVQPCRLVYAPDFSTCVDWAARDQVEFWGVYARTPDETGAEIAHHVADFATQHAAETFASRIACGADVLWKGYAGATE